MPTSDELTPHTEGAAPETASQNASAPKKSNRVLRAILSAPVILVIIYACIQAAAFALMPYGSKSELMWHDYREQTDLDTIAIGSSQVGRGFNPLVFDEVCQASSFCMGTPEQEPSESFIALREAAENHNIKRVIYGMDFLKFQGPYQMHPGRPFLVEKWKNDSVFERFGELSYVLSGCDWMMYSRSLTWLFPWVEQHISHGASSIPTNIRMRLDGTTLAEGAEYNEPGWHYVGKGYGNFEQGAQGDWRDYNSLNPYMPLNSRRIKFLTDMADYCAEHDIEFIVVVMPLPSRSLSSMRDYYQARTDSLSDAVTSHGGQYFDMNLGTSDVIPSSQGMFSTNVDYFMDIQHLSMDGADAFTSAVGNLVKRLEAGEDLSDQFMTYDEAITLMEAERAARVAAESGQSSQ